MVKKIRLSVTGIDDEVVRKFKQLVIAKHGTLRGFMGEELTEAMRLWVKREESLQKKGAKPDGFSI